MDHDINSSEGHLERSEYSENYKTYLIAFKLYVKQQADIVLLGSKAIDGSTLIYVNREFVEVSHYFDKITQSASSMIYERYLTDCLDSAYMHKNDLTGNDFEIVLYYFKSSHGLLDISNDDLYAESQEAIREAQLALYGSEV